jgi:hypothetical protein
VQEKIQDDVGREVVDYKLIHYRFVTIRDEWQEQAESVAIALLRIARYSTLNHQMLRKKAANPETN